MYSDHTAADGHTENKQTINNPALLEVRSTLTMRLDVWQLRHDCVGRFLRFPAC